MSFSDNCVDTHCHIEVPTNSNEASLVSNFLSTLSSRTACVCSTGPKTDWNVVEKLSLGSKGSPIRIIPGFGVHPWNCGEVSIDDSESWIDQLCQILSQNPTAIVGEIGLDKACNVDFTRQLTIFEAQLDVAAKFQRPVSVHCVRAFGPMLDCFTKRTIEQYPKKIIFHGFSGSVDFAKSLMKLSKKRGDRFFFGIGITTTAKLGNFETLLTQLPTNRLLWESDGMSSQESNERLAAIVQRTKEALNVDTMNMNANTVFA